jgi:Family of unknown function (DUF5335)/BON domain
VSAIKSQLPISSEHIKVVVKNGWVTLEGQAEWQYQKSTAENAVRRIKRVKGVSNLIVVRPHAEPTGIKNKAKWLPFLGIAYDPEDDVVEVALEGLDHLIYRPREIYVDDEVGGLTSIEIEDASGAKQIVKLKDKLLLPAPSH